MGNENRNLKITTYAGDFDKTNLTRDELTFIKSKLKGDNKLLNIFNCLSIKSIPVNYKGMGNKEKVNKKRKLMNSYLSEYNIKIKKINNEIKAYNDETNQIKKKDNLIEINYMILPLALVNLNIKEEKSIAILRIYGLKEKISANVMINLKTLRNRKWINMNFKKLNINVSDHEYAYVKKAMDNYIKDEVKEYDSEDINDFNKYLVISNYSSPPEPLKVLFPELKKSRNQVFFDIKETYNKLLQSFSHDNSYELLSMIAFLAVSFINGRLIEDNIAPKFIFMINSNKDIDTLELIKYIFGNKFNESEFLFEDTSVTNYFYNEVDVEKICKYITQHENNITILNLFYKIEENSINNLENKLFVNFANRKGESNGNILNSNIVVYSDYNTNSDLYFNLSIKKEITDLPEKKDYLFLLFYFTEFVGKVSIQNRVLKQYVNLCEEFEGINYINDLSKNKIYTMAILSLGLDLFLKFGEDIAAIEKEKSDNLLNNFKSYIINMMDIHNDNNIEAKLDISKNIEKQMIEILKIIDEEFDKINSSNSSFLLKIKMEPDSEGKSFGWYATDFKDGKFENVLKEKNSKVVFIKDDLISRLNMCKNAKFNLEYKKIEIYLKNNKILLQYKLDNHHLGISKSMYKNDNKKTTILSVNMIKSFLKKQVE